MKPGQPYVSKDLSMSGPPQRFRLTLTLSRQATEANLWHQKHLLSGVGEWRVTEVLTICHHLVNIRVKDVKSETRKSRHFPEPMSWAGT